MKDSLEGITALAIIVFIIWLFMDQPFLYRFTGERYVYPIVCKYTDLNWTQPTRRSFLSITCPNGSKLLTLDRESYIANQNRQQVVELTSDTGFIQHYDDCEVYDADNWRCNLAGTDFNKVIGMQDGDIINTASPFAYVSKIKWYWYKWMAK